MSPRLTKFNRCLGVQKNAGLSEINERIIILKSQSVNYVMYGYFVENHQI